MKRQVLEFDGTAEEARLFLQGQAVPDDLVSMKISIGEGTRQFVIVDISKKGTQVQPVVLKVDKEAAKEVAAMDIKPGPVIALPGSGTTAAPAQPPMPVLEEEPAPEMRDLMLEFGKACGIEVVDGDESKLYEAFSNTLHMRFQKTNLTRAQRLELHQAILAGEYKSKEEPRPVENPAMPQAEEPKPNPRKPKAKAGNETADAKNKAWAAFKERCTTLGHNADGTKAEWVRVGRLLFKNKKDSEVTAEDWNNMAAEDGGLGLIEEPAAAGGDNQGDIPGLG